MDIQNTLKAIYQAIQAGTATQKDIKKAVELLAK